MDNQVLNTQEKVITIGRPTLDCVPRNIPNMDPPVNKVASSGYSDIEATELDSNNYEKEQTIISI